MKMPSWVGQSATHLRRSLHWRDAIPIALAAMVTVWLVLPHASTGHSQVSTDLAKRPFLNTAGSLPSHEGGHLHLITDLGSVMIHTHDAASVDYKVHLETDASTKDAAHVLKSYEIHGQTVADGVLLRGGTPGHLAAGQLWVTVEVTIPRNYSLDVSTGGGNIIADNLTGHQTLLTQGGNIMIGDILGAAHLTAVAGGHITVKNVTGELIAETGGGHITTGALGGNAFLRTHGGHIRAGSIAGTAHLVTDGGNITLEHAGADLVAETAGGQIQVGEAAGLVHAKTDGGGIRVVRSSGPADLETADGSIYLTRAEGSVKASTATGGITAWFMSPSKESGHCELQSNNGDIVVYLGKTLPITIDAEVQKGESHGVIVDPAFPLSVHYDDARGQRVARAAGSLNGGGEVLRLRTVTGNIRLVLSNTGEQMQMYRQQMEGLQKQLDQLQKGALSPSPQLNDGSWQP